MDKRSKKPIKFNKLTQKKLIKFKIPNILKVTEISQNDPGFVIPNDEFKSINQKVNEEKTKLDQIPEQKMRFVRKLLDVYDGVKHRLKHKFGMKISSNASAKMYELIDDLKLIDGDYVRAFCNAELPGAFISAINHYVKAVRSEADFDWLASSYYPDGTDKTSTILGDYYGIYDKYRVKWMMGPHPNALSLGESEVENFKPLTGDLMDPVVINRLCEGVKKIFHKSEGATIYTSDAGIDVSNDYSKQEESTLVLNFGQAICGILSLAVGGSFVTKQFTFCTPFNRSLIAVLASLFDEFYITKPLTSRPANSEVYLVGKGFRGVSNEIAAGLMNRFKTGFESPLIPMEKFRDVDAVLLRAAQQIHERQQIAFLAEMVDVYKKYGCALACVDKSLANQREHIIDEWFANRTIRQIDKDAQLV